MIRSATLPLQNFSPPPRCVNDPTVPSARKEAPVGWIGTGDQAGLQRRASQPWLQGAEWRRRNRGCAHAQPALGRGASPLDPISTFIHPPCFRETIRLLNTRRYFPYCTPRGGATEGAIQSIGRGAQWGAQYPTRLPCFLDKLAILTNLGRCNSPRSRSGVGRSAHVCALA